VQNKLTKRNKFPRILRLLNKTALPIIPIQQSSIALEKTSTFYMDLVTFKKKHINASHCLSSPQALTTAKQWVLMIVYAAINT
jgi:hypothetical protein